jgi:hypothetical protein
VYFASYLVDEGVEVSATLYQVEETNVGYIRHKWVAFIDICAVTIAWTSQGWWKKFLVFYNQVGTDCRAGVINYVKSPLAQLVCTTFSVFWGFDAMFRNHEQNLLLEFHAHQISVNLW